MGETKPSVWKRTVTRVLPRGEFGRNVLTVMSGTALAQAVPVLLSPVLTRVYSPAEFGIFALFLATATIFGALATGRYELAVMLPKEDGAAYQLMRLCVVITIAMSALSLGVAVVWGRLICWFVDNDELAGWLLLLPVSVFLSGVYQTLNYWSNRGKRFRRIAAARVAQSSMAAAASIAFGVVWESPGGLVVGYLLGQGVAVAWLGIASWRGELRRARAECRAGTREVAVRYKDFPLFMGPSALLEVVSGQLPLVLLTGFFGTTVAGFLSLSQRVIRLPISVVARAIGEVFRQRASEDYATRGECRGIFVRTFKHLALLAIVPFGVLAASAPPLFAFVFGEEWRTSGEYAQILVAMYFLQFIVSPLSFLFMVAEKQKADLALQAFLVTATTLALVAGYVLFHSAAVAIVLLAVAYAIKYLVELALAYRFSKSARPPTDTSASPESELVSEAGIQSHAELALKED